MQKAIEILIAKNIDIQGKINHELETHFYFDAFTLNNSIGTTSKAFL